MRARSPSRSYWAEGAKAAAPVRRQTKWEKKAKQSAEETIRTIRRVTRKKYTADDKIRIVLEGLRGESGIRELCRREGIATNLYNSWSKEFLEAGKQRLLADNGPAFLSGELRT